ncbi:hypothetical protein [Carboxylicivirga sp. N1Y90]|uniref:hypothetical protein n=1 Tax=Carboxylicivirga fragile TaxID=3417571 RepID=UPI003D34062F|nr:hypothetical protein [Marinilabiliaceae bacterium N1Y90]
MKQKEARSKRSIQKVIRQLHRDIGFLTVGITIVFSISGIVLIYRDTDVFKVENNYALKLEANLKRSELSDKLDIRHLRFTNETKETIAFDEGTYNKLTGEVRYTLMEYPYLIDKMNFMHKAISREVLHWFATVYGILLLFLAISSFWMYKPNTRLFKRGIVLSSIGIVVAIILFIFWQ